MGRDSSRDSRKLSALHAKIAALEARKSTARSPRERAEIDSDIGEYKQEEKRLENILEPAAPLSLDQAIKLCQSYLETHKARLFSQCWGCLKFSKNNPEKMCFSSRPFNTGCRFVNELAKSQNK